MGGRPSSTRVRKQRVFEGMVNSTTPGLSFASAKGGRHNFIRSARPKFPLRVAFFTDHAAARAPTKYIESCLRISTMRGYRLGAIQQ